MAKSKFYAVRKGRNIGVFYSWSECEKQVKGYSGAEYKSFKTEKEALNYLNNNKNEIVRYNNESLFKDKKMIAYVDGSYDKDLKVYGSGAVILFNNEKITMNSSGNDIELVGMRNVAGEIKASQMAMEYALKQGVTQLTIYHDYEGIAKWCTKDWKANKIGTKKYVEYYNEVSNKLDVKFVKVKAHSGNKYNDEADQLAKLAIQDN